MKLGNLKSWGTAIGAAVFATLAMLPQAHGELVYDNDAAPAAASNTNVNVQTAAPAAQAVVVQPAPRADDRESLRQVLNSSQKAQNVVVPMQIQQAYPIAVQPQVQYAQPQYVQPQYQAQAETSVGASNSADVQNLSKTDLMRRERVREEIKNEDVLQERLEQLRLRDEKHRANQLMGVQDAESMQAPTPVFGAQGAVLGQPQMQGGQQGGQMMQEQVIGAAQPQVQIMQAPMPMTAQQQQMQQAQPQLVQSYSAQPQGYYGQDQIAMNHAMAVSTASEGNADKTQLSVEPRIGFASMTSTGGYDIRPHFSTGIDLGVGISDNVTFVLGYQYSEFGIALAQQNGYSLYNPNPYQPVEPYTLKQNLFEGGMKLHLVNAEAKLRPFLGGGGAYSKGYVNYNQQIQANLAQQGLAIADQDYEVNQFLGYLDGGFDVRINKMVSLTADFRYYAVLSASQNSQLNNAYLGGYYAPGADKAALGGSLQQASFYTVTGGATFSF